MGYPVDRLVDIRKVGTYPAKKTGNLLSDLFPEARIYNQIIHDSQKDPCRYLDR